jgi:glycosyltransferase involved in cell wall biosynthesis
VRRLLLIAYHFPPEPAAGALRPGYLAKYLPAFGWDVTVLTRGPLDRSGVPYKTIEARVLGEGFERSVRGAVDGGSSGSQTGRVSPFRQALRWIKATLYFPDRVAGWIPHAIVQALKSDRAQPYDAVMSTAMPASVHVVAAIVAALRGLPWIADYRDPWTGNQYAGWGFIQRYLQRALELVLLRRARGITTISPPIAALLGSIHGRHVTVIPNAADPDDWNGLENSVPERFSLCYTGSMYDGYRTPRLLFEALASLRSSGDPAGNAVVDCYGPNSDHVGELARAYGIESIVRQHGTVPRSEALAAQRRASDLLVFLNMDQSTSNELGSKIFEYAGAQRPVLAFGPTGSVMREYLAQRGMGWFAGNLAEAVTALREAHGRFASGQCTLQLPPGAVFTARDLAQAFAEVLDAVVTSPTSSPAAGGRAREYPPSAR